jgi:hypothetical protein
VIVLLIYFEKQMTNTSELWVQMGNASSVKDGQKSFASSHHNINKLRVKLATGPDASQHILRASCQIKVWHTSCLAKPPLPSPMEYEWRTVKDSLHPVYFEGNMSAEFLRDPVCSCKGKSQCKMSCVCAEQHLAWTDLCSCHGSESCKNVHSYTLAEDV